MTTQEAIEAVEHEIEELKRYLKIDEMRLLHGQRFETMLKAYNHLLSLANSVVEAEGEMPKKINLDANNKDDQEIGGIACISAYGWNECIDQITPLVAKKNERIRELETVLEAWHSVFGTTQLTHASERLRVAEADNDQYRKDNAVMKEQIDGKKKLKGKG